VGDTGVVGDRNPQQLGEGGNNLGVGTRGVGTLEVGRQEVGRREAGSMVFDGVRQVRPSLLRVHR
jgi:hypothetical protein